MKHTVYLSIGSNSGNRVDNIKRSIARLNNKIDCQLENISAVYDTDPQGFESDNNFFNIVVKATTSLSPSQFLMRTHNIEDQIGRKRSKSGKYEDRVIDVDILLYDDLVSDSPELTLPHPRMHTRPFVMVPLCEIASHVEHPTLKKQFSEILKELGDTSDCLRKSSEVIKYE